MAVKAALTQSETEHGIGTAVLLTSGAAIVNLALLFLESMLAARLVSTDEFGTYVLIVATVNFAMMLVDFGSRTAITRLIARDDGPGRAALVNVTLLFRIAAIAVVSLLLWLGQYVVALVSGEAMLSYLAYLPPMILVASLDQLLFGMLQGFQAYRPLAIAQIMRSALRLGLSATLLGPVALGMSGMLYSWTISFGVSALYQYVTLPVPKRVTLARGPLVEVIRFGAPLQVAGCLWFIFTRIQTIVLGAFAGPSAVAFFAVGSRIPEALQQVAESYMAVYFPKMTVLLAVGRDTQARAMFETSVRLVSFGAAALAFTCVVLSGEITETLFSPTYAASAPAFAILMVALHMVLVVNLMGYTLTSAGYPRRSLVVDVVRTTVALSASLALTPFFGVSGAASARLVSSYSGVPVVARLLRSSGFAARRDVWLTPTAILLLCSALAAVAYDSGVLARGAVVLLFITLNARLGAVKLQDLRLLAPHPLSRRDAKLTDVVDPA